MSNKCEIRNGVLVKYHGSGGAVTIPQIWVNKFTDIFSGYPFISLTNIVISEGATHIRLVY